MCTLVRSKADVNNLALSCKHLIKVVCSWGRNGLNAIPPFPIKMHNVERMAPFTCHGKRSPTTRIRGLTMKMNQQSIVTNERTNDPLVTWKRRSRKGIPCYLDNKLLQHLLTSHFNQFAQSFRSLLSEFSWTTYQALKGIKNDILVKLEEKLVHGCPQETTCKEI